MLPQILVRLSQVADFGEICVIQRPSRFPALASHRRALCTIRETFGLVDLEAMSVGTTIIAYDVGNLPTLLGIGDEAGLGGSGVERLASAGVRPFQHRIEIAQDRRTEQLPS